jgi:diacylglycerol kinase family enzyme
MGSLEKEKRSRIQLSPEERLIGALKTLRQITKEYPETKVELQIDDEIVGGHFLLLEIANMGLVGPNLQLLPEVDPADGRFDVTWVEGSQRKLLQEYLGTGMKEAPAIAPANTRRCQHVLLRYLDAPFHVDGKVFLTMETPVSISLRARALRLLDFQSVP